MILSMQNHDFLKISFSVMFFILKIVFNENVNCSDMRSSNKKRGRAKIS